MITLVGATQAGGFQASVTVSIPAGVEAGDRLLMFASANDENTIVSMPEGWAVLREDLLDPAASAFTWLFSFSAEDVGLTEVTVVWEADHWHFLHIVAMRGVDRIRTQDAAAAGSVTSVDLPVLQAQAGDVLLAGGFHWEEVPKEWSPGLTQITHMARGFVTGWETIAQAGPTTAHTVTCTTAVSGLMSATAVLLVPEPEPPPPITFPLDVLVELHLGGAWVDISTDVRQTSDISISRGRRDEGSTADASTCSLVLNNRHGKYSPRNPGSPYFGQLTRNTRLRVGITAGGRTTYRFAGEVSSWPVRWDLSGNDVWVPIRASGILRRLGQDSAPERSALRRFITAHEPVSYWTLTDGEDAVIAAPEVGDYDMAVLVGPPPSGSLQVARSRLDWTQGDLAPWLEPVARTTDDTGRISGRTSSDGVSADWSVDMVRAGAGGLDRINVLGRLSASGTQEWGLQCDLAAQALQVLVRLVPEDAAAPSFTTLAVIDEPRFFTAQARHVRLTVVEESGESAWSVWIDGDLIASGTTSGFEAPQPVAWVQYRWDLTEASAPGGEHASIGHITVWDMGATPTPPSALDVTRALRGYRGERAGVRIQRIAAEEGLAFEAVGDLELTQPMGPQQAVSPLSTMRDAEQVDDGVLYESRDETALVYRTCRSRYNQGVT